MTSAKEERPALRKITVITPVYNEEACIDYFYNRYKKAVAPLLDRYRFELLFVNNASVDRTLEIVRKLHERDKTVKIISQSRNFGYQASVVCGLTHAVGDAVVVIDVDCEDPPEMIADFAARWEQGYEIVYGERTGRPEFFLIEWGRKAFYRLTRWIADWEIVLDMAEFSLFSERVRRELLRNRSTFPYVRGELGYVGFRRLGIPYRRQARAFGKTHYSAFRMVKFALAGIFTASTFPLRLIVYVATPIVLIDFVALVAAFLPDHRPPMAILILLHLLFFSGSLAALAVYLARIYKDGTQRPVFIIDPDKSILPEGANHDGGP